CLVKRLVERLHERAVERGAGRVGGEVGLEDGAHAGQQAGLGGIYGLQSGLARCECGVNTNNAGRHAAADQPSDDLPHDHELVPGEADLLVWREAAPRHLAGEEVVPLFAGSAAKRQCSTIRGSCGVSVAVKGSSRPAKSTYRPVVDRVDREPDVVGSGVGPGEEVDTADSRLAAGYNDVVTAFHG